MHQQRCKTRMVNESEAKEVALCAQHLGGGDEGEGGSGVAATLDKSDDGKGGCQKLCLVYSSSEKHSERVSTISGCERWRRGAFCDYAGCMECGTKSLQNTWPMRGATNIPWKTQPWRC